LRGSDGRIRIAGAIIEAVTKSNAIETRANYSRDISGIMVEAVGVLTPGRSCLVVY
jgi:hypothetical protein